MLINNNSKTFEQPDAGVFLGTIIDVVDLGIVKTQFGDKPKIRIVWVLDKNDSEGRAFQVIGTYTQSMNEKSNLFKDVKDILGKPPAVPFESEELVGKSNQLFLAKNQDGAGKTFTNVKGILPLPAGATGPAAPKDFVRNKDKQKNGNGQTSNGQAAPAQQAAAQAQSNDVAF